MDYRKLGIANLIQASHKIAYTFAERSGTGDKAMKRRALELYLEGLGFISIGRLPGFNKVTILIVIRAFDEQLDTIKNVAGYGLLLIDMGSDSWVAYWIPGQRLGEKNLWQSISDVEDYKSLFRHFLARLRTKSKCCSKTQKMLEYSVKLLFAKRNNERSILNWQC